MSALSTARKPSAASSEQSSTLATMAPQNLTLVETPADAAVWGLLTLLRLGPSIFWVIKEHFINNLTPLIAGEKGNAVA